MKNWFLIISGGSGGGGGRPGTLGIFGGSSNRSRTSLRIGFISAKISCAFISLSGEYVVRELPFHCSPVAGSVGPCAPGGGSPPASGTLKPALANTFCTCCARGLCSGEKRITTVY